MILAIETSTQVCSVALRNRDHAISEMRIEGRGVHSSGTPQFIQELLTEHHATIDDLQAVLFSHGPGSYTGLRIGASLIKGLLYGKSIPLYTTSTLLSIASAVLHPSNIHPSIVDGPVTIHGLIDARRSHLYYQKFELSSGLINPISKPAVEPLDTLSKTIQPGQWVAGTGIHRLQLSEGVFRFDADAISAENLIRLLDAPNRDTLFLKRDIAHFEPEYVTMTQIEGAKP